MAIRRKLYSRMRRLRLKYTLTMMIMITAISNESTIGATTADTITAVLTPVPVDRIHQTDSMRLSNTVH